MKAIGAAVWLAGAALTSPAQGEVVSKSETSLAVAMSAEVPAAKAEVWRTVLAPAQWWASEHTWSGDAANLYLDAQATGCFCEKLPKPATAPADQRMGSVEHMHVVFADPERGLLRMKGGMGPLQAEPANGVWTITLKPVASGGTRIDWDYAVTGLIRLKGDEIASAIDRVLTEQLERLRAKLAGGESQATGVGK